MPSATFCSTACARTSLSRSDAVSAEIESSDSWCSWALTNRSTNAVTFARSASPAIGAKMKSTAPLAYAAAVSTSSLPESVMKMIGVIADWLRGPDQLRCLIAAHSRHPHIHQDHREALASDRLQRLHDPNQRRPEDAPADPASRRSPTACRHRHRPRGSLAEFPSSHREARRTPSIVDTQKSGRAARPGWVDITKGPPLINTTRRVKQPLLAAGKDPVAHAASERAL